MSERPREERIEDALVAWRERREQDPHAESGEWLAAHPDLAVDLAARLAAEQLLSLAFPGEIAEPPRVLGDFRVGRELGRGGMGVVYEAEQISMRRIVALKVLHPAVTLSPQATERFRREAQAAGRIHHTNIVPIFAMGQEAGCWYYAMERVRGRTLAEVVADLRRLGAGPAPDAPTPTGAGLGSSSGGREFYVRVARAFAGVADALHAAHQANVVHRDVKPSNLILDDDGTLKITDFGLARMDGELPTVTATGALIGTPAYMSPEQVRPGERPLDGRTDVYSLGATLYELLALRAPYRGARVEDVLGQILRGSPASPRVFERRIPRDLETIVLKAMEREPERRYRTAGDMSRDLLLFAGGDGIHARRTNLLVRMARQLRKHQRAVATVAVVALAGATSLWALVGRAREQGLRTELEYDRSMREAVGQMLDYGRFQKGSMYQIPERKRLELEERLAHAAALLPRRSDAWLLAQALPSDPERQLAHLDAARGAGLEEGSWRWARAHALSRASRSEEAGREITLAQAAPSVEDRLARLLAGRVHAMRGDRQAALRDLNLLLDGPSDAIDRPLALLARADAREQEGDTTGALEDYSAVESLVGASWPAIRMRMATLWLRLGNLDRATRCFDETFDAVRRTPRTDALGYVELCEGCLQGALPAAWWDRASAAAMEDRPDDPQVLGLRAKYLRSRPKPNLDQVADLEERALAAAPSDGQRMSRLVALAEIRLQQRRPADVIAVCEKALVIDPRCDWAHGFKARALAASGQPQAAMALAQEQVDKNPNHNTYHLCGDVSRSVGDRERALRMFERATALDPSCQGCAHGYARELSVANRSADAARFCRDVLKRWPDLYDVLVILSDSLDELNKPAEAVEVGRRLVRLRPDDATDRINLANALYRIGAYEEALSHARHAVEDLGFKERQGRRIIVDSLLGLRRTEDALRAMEHVVALGEDDEWLWSESGILLLEVGRSKEALAWLERGVLRCPKAARLHRDKATVLERAGELESAVASLERARDVDPSYVPGWQDGARLEAKAGRPEKGVEIARAGLAKTEDPNLRWVLGDLLMQRGRVKEAHETWAPLVAGPHATEWDWHLGSLVVARVGTMPAVLAFLAKARAGPGIDLACREADWIGNDWRSTGRGDDAKALAIAAAAWPDIAGEPGARILALGGKRNEAVRLLAGLPVPSDPPGLYGRACLFALVERREDALHWLDLAIRAGFRMPKASADPDFAAYPDDVDVRSRLKAIDRD